MVSLSVGSGLAISESLPQNRVFKKLVCSSPYTAALSNFFSLVGHYSPKEAVLSKPEKICKIEDNMVGAVPEVWVLESGTWV